MRDLVSYDRKHNEANGEHNRDGSDDNRSWNCGVEGETADPAVNALRHRQVRNLLASLLLSAGVPMLVAGDERGRTQRGSNNAYCQDNELSWMDWTASEDGWNELPEFVKTLLRLRRKHPVFRRQRFFSGRLGGDHGRRDVGWFGPWGREMDHEAWHDRHLLTLGMFFAGDRTGRRTPSGEPVLDDSFLLWLHAGAKPIDVVLPHRPWAGTYELVLDTSEEMTTTAARAGEQLRLPARSVVLLRAS
jgi:glycogen operon protein